MRWGRKRKREGHREHYILIKEWLIIFQRTIFQAPRLMTKHGQHPTSIIRFPPWGERINNAPSASRCRVPPSAPRPLPRAGGHFHTARAHHYSPPIFHRSRSGSCCYTGAVVLTSSSPSGMLHPSQEVCRKSIGCSFITQGPSLLHSHLITGGEKPSGTLAQPPFFCGFVLSFLLPTF